MGLEYIHSKNVLHRDIKPENLVLDDNGYVHITDFGISKFNYKNNIKDSSGTPGYMAPEVVTRSQYQTNAVDFYAIGVIGYEFMLGMRPYKGKSRKEIKEEMIAKCAYIKERHLPLGWTEEARDFINNLLHRKPENRLGYNGLRELKEHPWLKKFPWKLLSHKALKSPFIPKNKDNYDKKYCDIPFKVGIDTRKRYNEIRKDIKYQNIFSNYTFYRNDEDTDDDDNLNEDALIKDKPLLKNECNIDFDVKNNSLFTIMNQNQKSNSTNKKKTFNFFSFFENSNPCLLMSFQKSNQNKQNDMSGNTKYSNCYLQNFFTKKKDFVQNNRSIIELSDSSINEDNCIKIAKIKCHSQKSISRMMSINTNQKDSYIYQKKKIIDNYRGSFNKINLENCIFSYMRNKNINSNDLGEKNINAYAFKKDNFYKRALPKKLIIENQNDNSIFCIKRGKDGCSIRDNKVFYRINSMGNIKISSPNSFNSTKSTDRIVGNKIVLDI